MLTIFRRLNRWHIMLLLLLPVFLALINPNWLFNLSFNHDFIIMVDDYIYTGYQMALPQYVGWYPSDIKYFIERLSWILPSYAVHQVASPLIAHLIIHFVLYYVAIFSVYGILNKLANRRVALIMALLFGQYPLIMRSLGWNYIDGYSMTCMALGILFLTYATESRWRFVYLIGAGAVFMSMIIAHIFNGFYAPAIIFYFWRSDKSPQKLITMLKTGIYTLIGAGIVYGGLALFYYQLTGNVLLTNTLNTTQGFAQSLREFLQYHFSGLPAYWHVFLLMVAIIAIWVLIRRTHTLSTESRRVMQAVVGLFVGSYVVIVVWAVVGFQYSHVAFYHTNIVMTAFLLVGIVIYKPLTDLSHVQFRWVTMSAFLLPMLPFGLFTLSPTNFNVDSVAPLLIMGAIVCGFLMLVIHHPFRISMAMIIFATCSGVIVGNLVSIQTYKPDRYHDQRVFEQATQIADVINARYASLSLDKFRLWYDFSDPQLPTFHAVSSIYLWSLGRNARLNEAPPENTFFEADEIIILSSNYDQNAVLQMANTTLQNRAIITSVGGMMVGDIRLEFVTVRLSMLGENLLRYYFSESQSEFVLEESGWNGYEQVPQNSRPFRWTSEPTARLLLDLTDAIFDAQATYRISFVVAGSLEEDVVNSLSLTLNGTPIPLIRADNAYVGIVDGMLLINPTLELIFQTDRVSNPFDLGIQDGRKLGVALGELIIEPVINGVGND